MSETKLEVIEPPVGTVPLVGRRKLDVEVRVVGSAKILALHVEAYKERAPKEPKYKLDPGNEPKTYVGRIPAFDGKFWLRAAAQVEGGPSVTVDAGPYTGLIPLEAGGANEIRILAPAPGTVPLGMNNDFQVRVHASGMDTVNSVFAHCVTANGGEMIGGEEPLTLDATDEYTGTIFGSTSSQFRIKARAVFGDLMGGSSEENDENGNYDGQ